MGRSKGTVYLGDSRIRVPGPNVHGDLVQRNGEPFYRIVGFDCMPPFFLTVVSGHDHWMFVSSTGGLTCGRRDPDHALFPYETDDKIHDACATTGPRTIILADRGGRTRLWQPFARGVDVYDVERSLFKNRLGNKLLFEELNRDLGLRFWYCWSPSECYGFVRKVGLVNESDSPVSIELLDGLRNLLPAGIERATQAWRSTLVDAYKQAEAVPGHPAAIYSLSSLVTDRAEPGEALSATMAYCVGLDEPRLLLAEDQALAFSQGVTPSAEHFARGIRGAFFVNASLALEAGGQRVWHLLADVGLGPVEVTGILKELGNGLTAEAIDADIQENSDRLLKLVGSADGCQQSSDPLVDGRHLNNTLFNIMRGGTFESGYLISRGDFLQFIDCWNRPMRGAFEALFDAMGEGIRLGDLLEAARASRVADMERLVLEYLPLSFSRRHGDPSRPWNSFAIDLRNPDGSERLDYQGNWRDIFQNWEALAISYPEYLESFIAKFVNASTADGYNPYRISRAGFDWERLDPTDSWSNIGYWGDHQVVYLLRLLEFSIRCHPKRIAAYLERPIFAYAGVPYRLRSYARQIEDPRNTVDYDNAAAERIAERVAALGSDGKLKTLADGSSCRVSLLEKLLVPVLAKLGNFVPGGGIWMNTQRPEWNDANNALVGHGLSMVTLYYLRRLLQLLSRLLEGLDTDSFNLSREVADRFHRLNEELSARAGMLEGPVDDRARKAFMDALGPIGNDYRRRAYAGFSGEQSSVGRDELVRFLALASTYADHTIGQNRRDDGLFHSYNLLRFGPAGYAVEPLYEMLEGQVAVLGSGFLNPRESLSLLDALDASLLYREDQGSYMLYPDRDLPRFLQKNIVPEDALEDLGRIRSELEAGRSPYLERDCEGRIHFNPRFHNAAALRAALADDKAVSADEAESLCAVYEGSFHHRSFTGRSGAMYKYEGLGCIYWHMVSKLALAVSEITAAAVHEGDDRELVEALSARFEAIRKGLGLHKSPARYGGFTVDPYSHTPGFAGVQQPGMTGQVKEDLIARFAELGVCIRSGEIRFEPVLLRSSEFLSEATTWRFSADGVEREETLPAGSLGFTLCGVPVVYRRSEEPAIRVYSEGHLCDETAGLGLGQAWSKSMFARDGCVSRIEVDIPSDALR